MPGAKIKFPHPLVKSVNGIQPDAEGNITLSIENSSFITISSAFPTSPSDNDMHINNVTWDVFYREDGKWVLKGNIKGSEGGSSGDSVYSYREEAFVVNSDTPEYLVTLWYEPAVEVPITVSINGLIQYEDYEIVDKQVIIFSPLYKGDTLRINYAYRS